MVAAVEARTAEPVFYIRTPRSIQERYYCDGLALAAVPSDTAEVWAAGEEARNLNGSGYAYYLSRRDGVWAVRDSSWWIG